MNETRPAGPIISIDTDNDEAYQKMLQEAATAVSKGELGGQARVVVTSSDKERGDKSDQVTPTSKK